MIDKPLSEQELGALVSALAAEADAPTSVARKVAQLDRPIKVYDFRRPEKFSKEHLRALRILHESFARNLASSLTSYIRSNTHVSLTMVEPVAYEEYIKTLPAQTVVYVINLAPLPGQGVLELDFKVARVILDRLLGGSGLIKTHAGPITEIELALLRTLGTFVVSRLCEAWASVTALEPSVQEPVLSPEFVQVTLPAETTVMLVHEISVLKTVGTLSLCLPHPLLQPAMDKLKAQVWFSSSHPVPSDERDDDPRDELGHVVLPITAELGRAEITLRELLELAEGQIIKLDLAADGDLPIRVGEHVKFFGRPGLIGKNIGVRVTRAPR